MELVLLDELVEVDGEELEGDALVVAEVEGVEHEDGVGGAVRVLLPEELQDPDLLDGLAMEAFLVPDELERDVLLPSVVVGLDHLPERALPDHLQHLQSTVH